VLFIPDGSEIQALRIPCLVAASAEADGFACFLERFLDGIELPFELVQALLGQPKDDMEERDISTSRLKKKSVAWEEIGA